MRGRIRRRQLLFAASALLATPLARAQQSQKVRRIGYLHTGPPPASAPPQALRYWKAQLDSLERAGYKEGANLIIEWRYADGKPERLPELAADLVRARVELIITTLNPATLAAQRATRTIPIVMLIGSYPVENGFIASHAQPGGNITGLDTWDNTLSEKWYQILKFAVPQAKIVATLWGETTQGARRALGSDFGRRVSTSGLSIVGIEVGPERTISQALDHIAALRPDGLAIEGSAATNPHYREIAAFCLKQRLPSLSVAIIYVQMGGLLSYGPDFLHHFDRLGSYVDRILKGTNPAVIPVEHPTKFELALNRKTAEAIGVKLPADFMNRVDQVIE